MEACDSPHSRLFFTLGQVRVQPVTSVCHSERRLDVLHLLIGYLPSGPISSRLPPVPLLCLASPWLPRSLPESWLLFRKGFPPWASGCSSVLASSRSEALWVRVLVLSLYHRLGFIIYKATSFIQPHQTATFLGVVLVGPSFRTCPSPVGFPLYSHSFLHSMRSLQLLLRDHWDFVVQFLILAWAQEIESYLLWWFDAHHLLTSLDLISSLPDLLFWSDASVQGWGQTFSTALSRVSGRSWSSATPSTCASDGPLA